MTLLKCLTSARFYLFKKPCQLTITTTYIISMSILHKDTILTSKAAGLQPPSLPSMMNIYLGSHLLIRY